MPRDLTRMSSAPWARITAALILSYASARAAPAREDGETCWVRNDPNPRTDSARMLCLSSNGRAGASILEAGSVHMLRARWNRKRGEVAIGRNNRCAVEVDGSVPILRLRDCAWQGDYHPSGQGRKR